MSLWIKIFMIVYGIIFGGLIYLSFKVLRTSTVFDILSGAIFDYNIYLIKNFDYKYGNRAEPDLMPYLFQRDKKIFDKTLWRFWDWGYKRILPPEDFEKLKPFIEKRLNKNV